MTQSGRSCAVTIGQRIQNLRTYAYLIAVSAALTACGPKISPVEMAQEEVFTFHEHYDAGNISPIYAEGSVGFRNAVDETEFGGMLRGMHEAVGDHLSSQVVSADTVFELTGASVKLSLLSRFERADVVEEFVYVAERGKYRLNYYGHQLLSEAASPADSET